MPGIILQKYQKGVAAKTCKVLVSLTYWLAVQICLMLSDIWHINRKATGQHFSSSLHTILNLTLKNRT